MKKLKKQKVKLVNEDFNQALDYAYVMLVAYSNTLERCSLVHDNKNIGAAYDRVIGAMAELYQIIGSESCE